MSNITGFPGHNRGKKWVPGVGYRFPPKPPAKPLVCTKCGQPGIYVMAPKDPWGDPPVSEVLCDDCHVIVEGG